HLRHEFVREAVPFDSEAGGCLDQLGDLRDRLGTELARFAFQRMGRDDQRRRILVAHGLFDLRDRLDPILLEISEDADEGWTKLGPALLEVRPVDDVLSLLAQTHAPQMPEASGNVPRGRNTGERVKFALAASHGCRGRSAWR